MSESALPPRVRDVFELELYLFQGDMPRTNNEWHHRRMMDQTRFRVAEVLARPEDITHYYEFDPDTFIIKEWNPYEIEGKRHPGVFVHGLENPQVSTLDAIIQPQGHTLPHTHSGTEIVEAIDGEVQLTAGLFDVLLQEGQGYTVPPDTIHSVKNVLDRNVNVKGHFNPGFFQQQTKLVD